MTPLEITLAVLLLCIGLSPWIYSIGKYAFKQFYRLYRTNLL